MKSKVPEIKKIELKVGESSRPIEFIDGRARIIYAGMVDGGRFSLVICRAGYSYNLYFPRQARNITISEYRAICVERVSEEKIVLLFSTAL